MSLSSPLSQALKGVCPHRDVVPAYFVRDRGVFIVTGVTRTHGGAVIVDDAGQILQALPSKSAALRYLATNNN